MSGFDELVARLEELLGQAEDLDDDGARSLVFELLDGVDTIHRFALHRLADRLGAEAVAALRHVDPAVSWLFDVYGVGLDEPALADAALDTVRPYIHSHGGEVTVLDAAAGVVRLRMSGACAGCTASAQTLRHSVDEALREHLPGFLRTEVEEDDAPAHPPPVGPVSVQLGRRPAPVEVPVAAAPPVPPPATDLWADLDAAPAERWPLRLRTELSRWAADDAREAGARTWVRGQLDRAATATDLAEAFLAAALELPPAALDATILAVLQALADEEPEAQERFAVSCAGAMARFPVPQWLRLKDGFAATAAGVGLAFTSW